MDIEMDIGSDAVNRKSLLITTSVVIWALLCPLTVEAGASDREIIVGDSVPIVTLEDVAGKRHRIPDDEDMSVILFWSTWSPRSAKAIDLWERLIADYPGEPFQVVSVAAERDTLTEDDYRTIEGYIRERQVSLPVVVDEELELFNSYGVKALPTVFMLSSSGLVLFRYPGMPSAAALDLREELETRLGLREPETPEDKAARADSVYRPKGNAIVFFRMGKVFEDKGSFEKAAEKYIEALQKDLEYEDPLRGLERVYFREGRTREAEESLETRLTEGGLEDLIENVYKRTPPSDHVEEEKQVPPEDKPLSPMERMRLLMEENKTSVPSSEK